MSVFTRLGLREPHWYISWYRGRRWRRRFTTDGCSGGMTWVWRKLFRREPPWEGECVQHDRAYWRGGRQEDRWQADVTLMANIARNGHPWFAILMFIAVRVGGHPLLPLPWRWGYGYSWPRRYDK